MALVDDVMHPVYLPFRETELRQHFVHPGGDGSSGDPLAYYQQSLRRLAEYEEDARAGNVPRHTTRQGRQVEKDERFWTVASLMAVYHRTGPEGRVLAFSELLAAAGLTPPDEFDDWPTALAGQLDLYFEVALPSPRSYGAWLRENLDARAPIPYVRESAADARRLEGPTHADAVLLARDTGVAIVFEAKVLSDVSGQVTFDAARNQLARYVDVLLEEPPAFGPMAARRPDRSFLVLLTPELFRTGVLQRSRLYGWLMAAYQDPSNELLSEHLAHRDPADLRAAANRIGWATWEDVERTVPSACGWLRTPVVA